MVRNAIVVLAAACLASASAVADTREAQTAAETARTTSCQSCHGTIGDSTDTSVPRLNGQSPSYLYDRLHSLRYPISESPRAIHNMGAIAPELTTQVIAALANYYAGQAPTRSHPLGAAAAEGERIYKLGAGKDIPACQSCHGARGEGSGKAPRLAGQHAEYLELQLQAFAMAARISDPMNHHVWVMTSDQMHAVAAYLGG